jgi:GNAT superfamily N-acetyltransferase
VPSLIALVRELAEYENEADSAKATEGQFTAALFPPDPATARSHALVAEATGPGGPEVVGMAVWYLTFSTWTGTHGIWLEDLFVRPEHRGSGLGKALLRELATIAVERGHQRVEWWVLRWNRPSLDFYDALGAQPMDEWVHYRLDGDPLTRLGGEQASR